jgi:hypothetical protein
MVYERSNALQGKLELYFYEKPYYLTRLELKIRESDFSIYPRALRFLRNEAS